MARLSAILVFVVCVFLGYGCNGSSGRAPKKKPAEGEKPKLFMSQEERELERKRDVIGQKKEALNETEWDIDMSRLSSPEQASTIKDTIVFTENKVLSKRLESQGFLPTNYTLSLKDDDKVIWETMQTGEGQLVFFRGEISPDLSSMSGVISFQKPGGSEDYSFSSTDKRKIFMTGQEQ